jgi:hypothetical protein
LLPLVVVGLVVDDSESLPWEVEVITDVVEEVTDVVVVSSLVVSPLVVSSLVVELAPSVADTAIESSPLQAMTTLDAAKTARIRRTRTRSIGEG